MFHSDFVALPGNQTHNFVARHMLGFIATSSLCLGIELVGVRVRVRVRIPRQIRHKSGTAPAQIRHKSGTNPAQLSRFDASLTDTNPAQIRHKSGTNPAQIRHSCQDLTHPLLLALIFISIIL